MNIPFSMTQLFSLDGKVAVVTGAAAGIGKATALLLADAGATVIVADRDYENASSVADEIGSNAAAVAFDLRDDRSIASLFETVCGQFGTLDVLVNNGGIYPRYGFNSLTEQQWHEMQKINIWGCFVAMREAVRAMKQRGKGGRIVNVSSIGARRTAVNDQIAYNASKAALDSMTLSAALEFASHGILVNSICPGAVRPLQPKEKSPGHVAASGPLMAEGRILLGRPASAWEVAAPILMLASAAGGYITGQTIVVDGGFSVS